jgi:four helix bundle protein
MFYFENLIVWQKALILSKKVYKIISMLPSEEKYALSDQMRRSSISIMSNIAEWSWRSTNPDRNHFYTMAKWSSMELASQLILAKELWYVSPEGMQEELNIINDISSILFSFIRK